MSCANVKLDITLYVCWVSLPTDVFSFSVVLDFPFSTMVHRTIKLAWYHVYKLVKTYLQDARLGSSHQEIALKEKIQIPYRNSEMSCLLEKRILGQTSYHPGILSFWGSQVESTPEKTGGNGACSQNAGAVTSQLLPSVLESARTPSCFSIYMYPWGEENAFEQNDWLSQNCLAFFQHHTWY